MYFSPYRNVEIKKKLLDLSILNVKQYKVDRMKQAEKLNPGTKKLKTNERNSVIT